MARKPKYKDEETEEHHRRRTQVALMQTCEPWMLLDQVLYLTKAEDLPMFLRGSP